jgi:hypothetical protein
MKESTINIFIEDSVIYNPVDDEVNYPLSIVTETKNIDEN